MRLSRHGLKFIARFEGLSLTAYHLAGEDYYTIGYGHTGPDVKPGERISEGRARTLLKRDTKWASEAVNEHVKVNLKQNQHDALTSFVFNVGEGAFTLSTLLRRLNAGERHAVPYELNRWTRDSTGSVSPGLVRRRGAEGRLFVGD